LSPKQRLDLSPIRAVIIRHIAKLPRVEIFDRTLQICPMKQIGSRGTVPIASRGQIRCIADQPWALNICQNCSA
jgi:hypothetical protein